MVFAPLDEFYARSLSGERYPSIRYQSWYASPCTFGPIDSECMVKWRPLPRNVELSDQLTDFGIDATNLPSDVSLPTVMEATQFVASYWSGPIECRLGYDRVVLDCGVWNAADLQRKQMAFEDCIGHAGHIDCPPVWPIAWAVGDSGLVVGLDLGSGEIRLSELPATDGKRLATSLGDFLQDLHCVHGFDKEVVHSF